MKTEPRDLDRRFYEGFRAGTELVFDLLERDEPLDEIERVVGVIREMQYGRAVPELRRRAPLHEDDVRAIRQALKAEESMLEIAERIGCSIATIRDIDRGRSYQSVV